MPVMIDPNDLPDDRDDYRYSLLLETEGPTLTLWQADDYDDISAMADAYDKLIRERQAMNGHEPEGMPMSIIDHYAHLAEDN